MTSLKEIYQKRRAEKAEAKAAKQAELDAKKVELAKSAVRTPQQLEAEYQRLCQLVGDKQYRMKCFEAEVAALVEQIFHLNQEFDKSKNVHGLPETKQDLTPPTAPVLIQPAEQQGGDVESSH